MKESQILDMFESSGALFKGHFLLSSGLHSEKYLQCALLLSNPSYAEMLCNELALKLQNERIDIVVGPAYGGIIVAHEVARGLGVKAMFTERKDGQMMLRRNFNIPEGSRVLVVEDVVTTGKSVKEVISLLKNYNADIVGVGSLVNRSATSSPFGDIPFYTLLNVEVKTYDADKCPLCESGVALAKPGSR
ncbi:MAG: orotate phosphoribosyltransferase [Candidatus Omnitrophota bacterium]